ncbi:uncharacterized protein LOC108145398 [Drosophila elegans]|uniref:uncharacterized protein LOC108145398 n=1 Tax=Drosophila elegans TaxID=30023 RepID=UPI0007E7301F|nr:uncharacterized protein LOC108145398 [Drosophila elegans]
MLPTNASLSTLSTFVRLAYRHTACRMTGRISFSTRRSQGVEYPTRTDEYRRRDEPNPEYHHAPRCYVKNFQKHQDQAQDQMKTIRFNNPRYRWADFRRRMVYGTYDI